MRSYAESKINLYIVFVFFGFTALLSTLPDQNKTHSAVSEIFVVVCKLHTKTSVSEIKRSLIRMTYQEKLCQLSPLDLAKMRPTTGQPTEHRDRIPESKNFPYVSEDGS